MTTMNKWRNEEVKGRVGVRGKMSVKKDWNVSICFRNSELLSRERLTKRVCEL